MKKRQFLTTLVLGFVMFFASDIKAQNDAFFTYQSTNTRNQTPGVGDYNISTNNNGVGVEGLAENTPLSGGLLALTATGLVYLIGKRRKENE